MNARVRISTGTLVASCGIGLACGAFGAGGAESGSGTSASATITADASSNADATTQSATATSAASAATSMGGDSSGGATSNSTLDSGDSTTGQTETTGATDGGNTGSDTGGDELAPDCQQDSDCRMFSDCCACLGLGPDEIDPVECPILCIQPKCEELGIAAQELRCVAGRCVLDRSCDHAQAACDSLPPACPEGEIAMVKDGCWGGCLPIEECREIENCKTCSEIDPQQHCVAQRGKRDIHHCVVVPETCQAQRNCDCLATNVCPATGERCFDEPAGEKTVCAPM